MVRAVGKLEVVLSSRLPCPPVQHQVRCGRAEQEHRKAESSSSATFRLCAIKPAQEGVPSSLLSQEKSISSTVFPSLSLNS